MPKEKDKKIKKDGIIRIGDSSKFFGQVSGIDEKIYQDFVDQYMLYKDTDDLIISIKTSGGSLTYSMLISEIISRHKGCTVAQIEYNAFSGGTIIALACNKIKMTRTAAVSCIDPQSSYVGSVRHARGPLLRGSTQQGWIGLISEILTNYYDETDKNFSKQMLVILQRRYDPETTDKLFNFFTQSHPHDTPLTIYMLPEELKIELYEPEPEPEPELPNLDKIVQQATALLIKNGINGEDVSSLSGTEEEEDEDRDEKMDLLIKLKSLEQRGKITLKKHYSIKSSIDDIRTEYRNQISILADGTKEEIERQVKPRSAENHVIEL